MQKGDNIIVPLFLVRPILKCYSLQRWLHWPTPRPCHSLLTMPSLTHSLKLTAATVTRNTLHRCQTPFTSKHITLAFLLRAKKQQANISDVPWFSPHIIRKETFIPPYDHGFSFFRATSSQFYCFNTILVVQVEWSAFSSQSSLSSVIIRPSSFSLTGRRRSRHRNRNCTGFATSARSSFDLMKPNPASSRCLEANSVVLNARKYSRTLAETGEPPEFLIMNRKSDDDSFFKLFRLAK